METGLLGVIEAEALRESEAILAQARRERDRILEEAGETAGRIRDEPPPVVVPPPGDERLSDASSRLLAAYHRQSTRLKEETAARLEAKSLPQRRRLVSAFLQAAVAELRPGTYRLGAPPGVGEATPPPRGVTLEVTEGVEDRFELASADGMLSLSWSLRSVVELYFEREAAAVARLLMGDVGA